MQRRTFLTALVALAAAPVARLAAAPPRSRLILLGTAGGPTPKKRALEL